MRFRGSRRIRGAGLLLALAGPGLAVMGAGVGAGVGAASAAPSAPGIGNRVIEHASCGQPAKGSVRCLSYWHRMTQPTAKPVGGAGSSAASSPSAVAAPKKGLSPANLRAEYKLPATGGKGQIVAIVDAFDNPKVESDLKAYRAAWKLPPCTTANKCFRKADQRGGTKYPVGRVDWGVEISLDVQAVSAVCPSCKILLVESDNDSANSIGAAENEAVKLGAKVVSNSYGTPEDATSAAVGKKFYTHKGVPILVASGDSGFTAASFPAVLPNVWAIGGTYLTPKKGGFSEQAWDGSGSGCSAWFAKPSWQKDSHCGMRTIADISAVAFSDDGFAEYDTYDLGPDNGWIAVDGTSLSSPLVAGMIGLAANASKVASPSYPYAHRTGLADVIGGSNGYCGGDYLCTGLKGYDAPTGLGSPRGVKSL